MLSQFEAGRVEAYRRRKLPHWDAEHGIQFLTLHLANGRVLTRDGAAIVMNAVLHYNGVRYSVVACCVMPDHLHVILQPGIRLATIVQAWKSFTARMLGGATWWQPNYFDRLIRTAAELEKTVEYVMDNPDAAALPDWHFCYLDAELLHGLLR